MNSHLLPPFISYRSSEEKLIKYQANSSCVIMSIILMTTLFYKALILQGEIWCWSLLGLKGLRQRFIGSLLFFSLYRGVCLILQATGFLRRLNSSLCEITSFVKSLVDSLARAHPTTPFQWDIIPWPKSILQLNRYALSTMCEVKMCGWILAKVFCFLCFMDQDKFKVDMNAKKKEANKFIFNHIIFTR